MRIKMTMTAALFCCACTTKDGRRHLYHQNLFLLLARYVPSVARGERVYEISVRSMNIDDQRPTTNADLRAHSHILGKFQTAITLQRVNRSPSCLVLGGVFGDVGSNGAISGWI